MTTADEIAEDVDVVDKRRQQAPAFERSISPIAGRFGAGRGGKLVVLTALIGGCGVFIAATRGEGAPKSHAPPLERPRQVVPFEPLRAAPTLKNPGPGAPQLTTPGPDTHVPAMDTANATPSTGDQRRAELAAVRGAPMLAYSRSTTTAELAQAAPPLIRAEAAAPSAAPTELDELRRGSTLGRAHATRLPDRNFLIIAGTSIPCLLQTAMDTATPGYVSCLIPRDVLSDNGAVVLMEKGTRVLGEYRSGLRQGQRRLFVLWTRAVTPAGVAISLDSPAADALGRAGFDGDVDTHFWDRFGGALLMSIVDDGAVALGGSRGELPRLPSDAAGVALQNSVGIPASLRKAQGAQVSIFVAQDFDFSGVYGLRNR